MASLVADHSSEMVESKVRFEVELEFVQCLANPEYLKREFRVAVVVPFEPERALGI